MEEDNNKQLSNNQLISIETEMQNSYLEYAMSVIVGRALPDVRDGLKPVHRRVLYAMEELGNGYNRAYKKSARIVGDVIGKYHPHGDTAVYDTIVRMAQPFAMRQVLVDGQGNFGSIDGDRAAAMRYTEIRMDKIAHEMLRDIDKNTVDFIPNYDGSENEPAVLPTRVPNLLLNGSSGIAVGMATNIPPHNLGELIDATIMLVHNPKATVEDLLTVLPGPDFPTAGIINGNAGIKEAYATGRGKVQMRAVSHIEGEDKQSIVVTELPYQVNKARLITKIAELIKEKKIEGITALRDESDKDGMRMVIELRRGEVPEVILNNLYKLTEMQSSFGINMVAIDKGKPQLMNLGEILQAFINHRREVITRRTIFELNKAKHRAHILEGLVVALSNIDDIVEMIKAAPNPAVAKEQLMAKAWQGSEIATLIAGRDMNDFKLEELDVTLGLQKDSTYTLSGKQASAILELRLQRLTGLEKDKIFAEFNEILENIIYLLDILQHAEKLTSVLVDELLAIKDEFQTPRLSQILEQRLDLTLKDLIAKEERVLTLSHSGYIKTQSLDDYKSQRRGGKGKAATKMKEEDFINKLFIVNSHDDVLCFSSSGKVYWLKVYELPLASRTARGKPIVNLLPLDENEVINTILPVKEFSDDEYILMATSNGTIKKTKLSNFSNPRKGGIIALELRDNDALIGVELATEEDDVMLFATSGKVIRFANADVRSVGRTAIGVRGIKLAANDAVVSLIVVRGEDPILTATKRGYGKRTEIAEYRTQNRGGSGVISIKTSERNGEVVGSVQLSNEDDIMLISDQGTLVRTPAASISIIGRNTQGVRLIDIADNEELVSIARIIEDKDDDESNDEHNENEIESGENNEL